MPNLEIFYTLEAWQTIKMAVDFRNQEVAGFGRCRFDGERLVVDDILVPPQEVGGAHAELDFHQGDYDWLLSQIIAKGDQPIDWRLWWHSHVNMGTSPSPTDHGTLKTLSTQWLGWAAGTVFNMRGEATGWIAYDIEYTDPLRGTSVNVQTEADLTVLRALTPVDEELREKVRGWMEHVSVRSYQQQNTPTPVHEHARTTYQPHMMPPVSPSAAGGQAEVSTFQTHNKKGRGKRSKVTEPSSAANGRDVASGQRHPSGRKWIADMTQAEWVDFVHSDEYAKAVRGRDGTDLVIEDYAQMAAAQGRVMPSRQYFTNEDEYYG